jgi:hypothetical protein
MLEQRKISYVATGQLAAWEKLAADWTVYHDETQVRCASCHIAIWRLNDDSGAIYVYGPGQKLALTVAHLRQAHMDLDPDR